MGKRIVIRQAQNISQSSATSMLYNRSVYMSWGEIVAHKKNIGGVDVKLSTGFTIENILLSSDVYPGEGYGSIKYPPIGTQVRIIHPDGDLKNGMLIPASLNYRDATVKTDIIDPGTDIKIMPGGWKTEYDQETGNLTVTNGDFTMVIDNSAQEISINDWNDNEINLSDGVIEIKNGGEVQIQGAVDYAVGHTDLNTALQTFITDLNAKLTTALGTIPYTWPGTSIDISGSKVDEVRLP